MAKPFLRRFFNHASAAPLENAESEAEHGSADTQFHLGLKYAGGEGAAQDYAQAAEWYLKAARQDHALAQFNLGVMYANGQGVARNEREAETWFGRAARQQDAGAQHHLGMGRYRASILDLPENMRESRIEAYKWFILAAAQGYDGSDTARATVSLKMTHEDVSEAIQRVDRFLLSMGGDLTQQ